VKKKPRKQVSGPNWGLIAGIAMGVVGLVIGGFVVYKVTRPKEERAVAASNDLITGSPTVQPGLGLSPVNLPAEVLLPPALPLPDGWIKVVAKEVDLSAHWPGQPDDHSPSHSDMGVNRPLRVENRGYDYQLQNGAGGLELDVMILPPGLSPSEEERAVFLRLPRHQIVKLGKGQVTVERSASLAGSPATEIEFAVGTITGVYRYGFVRTGGKTLFVMAKAAGPKTVPDGARQFLDSIRPAGR
jgi:hypothetical protein